MGNFNVEDYVTVNERLTQFWGAHREDGAIDTELVHLDGPDVKYRMVVVKAWVYVGGRKVASGLAKEREGTGGMANKTAFIENCETSAVGRALANYGMSIAKSVASKEEMQRVEQEEAELVEVLSQIKTAAEAGGDEAKEAVNKHWSELKEGNALNARVFLEELLERYG